MPDSTFTFISSAADLDNVPYIGSRDLFEQTADTNRVYLTMVQSAAIHPTWSVDDIACYLVNDEGIDAAVVVAVLRENGYTVATLWQLAKDSARRVFAQNDGFEVI